MKKLKHTPLTLYAKKAFDDNGCITAPIYDANDKWMFSAYGSTKEEAEANAALIVKAVNNHEKLVEALRSTIEQYEHILLHDPSYKTVHSTRAALEEVKAALKEAEGGEG